MFEEFNQGGNVLGKVRAQHATDRLTADPALDHSVVIKHSHAIGCKPDVALKPRGAELQGQLECVKGVLGRMGARTSMGERDRRVET